MAMNDRRIAPWLTTRNPYDSILLDIYEDRVKEFTEKLDSTPRWRWIKRRDLEASRKMYQRYYYEFETKLKETFNEHT